MSISLKFLSHKIVLYIPAARLSHYRNGTGSWRSFEPGKTGRKMLIVNLFEDQWTKLNWG